jgi:ubiquinone/menaquinone biosynthesis C-methylase UbiE
MDLIKDNSNQKISSYEYTNEYYETSVDGYYEFSIYRGWTIPLRLSIPLELAQLSPGNQVLDIGCGRGEILLHCGLKGIQAVGIDYSDDAVRISRQILNQSSNAELNDRVIVGRADAEYLPIADESIDIVFMLDLLNT